MARVGNRPGVAEGGREASALSLVPKEHGASFMAVHSLLLGIVAGFAAGGNDLVGLLLAVSFGALFLPFTAAVSVASHPRLAAAARRRAVVVGLLEAGIAVLALVHGPMEPLLALSGAGAGLACLYAVSRSRTGPRSVPTQLAAIAGIAILAPYAWLLIAGAIGRWPLSGVAAFLAFGGTVPYVRERVRRRRFPDMSLGERLRGGAPAILWQVVALGGTTVAAIAGSLSPLVPIAFVPGAVKVVVALGRRETRPPIKRIGYLETAISTVFAILAGFGLGITTGG